MTQSLPSYAEATSRDPWPLVRSYLRPQDLHAACLVSRRWFRHFMPLLWGDPVSKFASRTRSYDCSFVAFLRCLGNARTDVRELIHTVDLSLFAAHRGTLDLGYTSDLDGPWLHHLLFAAPNLRSLVIPNCPLFNYKAILSVKTSLGERLPYKLRLFAASGCDTTSSRCLTDALTFFPDLVYLDLSSARFGADWEVLRHVANLLRLRILKLRDTSLGDAQMIALARALGTKVWSLDVRDNQLSDQSIGVILEYCFLPPSYSPLDERRFQDPAAEAVQDGFNRASIGINQLRISGDQQNQDALMPPPAFSEFPHVESDTIEDDSEAYIVSSLAGQSYNPMEGFDGTKTGLTHLYVSGNRFSVGGIAKFLRTTRLQSFDCGTVAGDLGCSSAPAEQTQAIYLVPELAAYAHEKLTYLRIDHRIFCATINTARCQQLCRPEGADMEWPLLAPSMLPYLRHLVLTDVPFVSEDQCLTEALKTFLSQLGEQEMEVAREEAEATAMWNSLPPHVRARQRREHGHPTRRKRGLQNLDLELESENVLRRTETPSSDVWGGSPVTEDFDSYRFHRASSNDFSFFAAKSSDIKDRMSIDGDGTASLSRQMEMGLVLTESRSPRSPTTMDVEMTMPPSRPPPADRGVSKGRVMQGVRVKDAIAQFRREKRAACEAETNAGRGGPGAGGNWNGNVRILRGL